MYITGINQDFASATCDWGTCKFYYSQAYTPSTWRYSALGGSGGSLAHVYRASGQIYGATADFSSESDYEIKQGGWSCALDPAIQTNYTPYSSYHADSIVDGGGNGIVKWCVGGGTGTREGRSLTAPYSACSEVANTLPAGRVNVSFRVDDDSNGYGQALPSRNSWQVTLDGVGTVFQYTAHPTITSLSYITTGLNGGSALTVTGTNFATEPADNVVSLAGVPCKVISSTQTQLVCLPGATNASTVVFNASKGAPVWDSTAGPAAFKGRMWPAGRGLLHTVFGSMYDWNYINTRAANTWPPAGTAPLVQYINTDSVSGYSWNEVCA